MTTGTAPPRVPLTPARRWILGVGVVLSVLLIAWGALQLITVLGRTSEERTATLPVTGGQLVVASSGGSIRIAVGDVSDIRVVTQIEYGLARPGLRQESGPDGVFLDASCRWFDNLCSVDYDITVPTGLEVRAESSGGSIAVRGVSRDVDAKSSGGSITVADTSGAVRARSSGGSITISSAGGTVDLDTSGGSVTGTGLRGDARAESSGGSVRLTFDAPPRSVEASSSGGSVEVRVPRVDGGYRVDASSSGGRQVVDVPTDPASERFVKVRSSGGSARVMLADAS